jgi:membrane protein DedA with SNARE-associated domain
MLTSVAVSVIAVTFYLTDFVTESVSAQTVLAQFGYVGIFLLAVILGLNVIVPIAAVSFTPLFVASGLSLPLIIIALTLGTLVADALGFWFGHWSKSYIIEQYPHTYQSVSHLYTKRRSFLIPALCFYVAFLPLPNEVFLIPLAVLGMPFRHLIVPLLIGNTINQTLLAYGIQNLFWWWM